MPATDLFEHLPGLERTPLIGIIRGYPTEAAVEAAIVAQGAGLSVLEVTMDSPGAIEAIEQLTERADPPRVGVGTVTEASQVGRAAGAGASFVVTPGFSTEVVEACVQHGLPAIPGVATPTEILVAMQSGVPAVKLFPAEQLGGPSFIRAVAQPLGHPPMVPTGGVSPENAREYLESGAVAVGAGSSLFSAEIGRYRDWDALEKRVGTWIEALI